VNCDAHQAKQYKVLKRTRFAFRGPGIVDGNETTQGSDKCPAGLADTLPIHELWKRVLRRGVRPGRPHGPGAGQPNAGRDVIQSQGHPVFTNMSSRQAFHASNRFGLGARPDELRLIGTDARGWLHTQLEGGPRTDPWLSDVAPSHETLGGLLQKLYRIRSLKKSQKRDGDSDRRDALADMRRDFRKSLTSTQFRQLGARMRVGIETREPFRERLVRFWSNHFTVSTAGGKRLIVTSCTAYEAETVRKHLDGHFADMLIAVEQHPVMLAYLDNLQSLGPNSRAGRRRRKRGLNENLAREILELHTLGVDGGYGQADVTSLARIITGWTIANDRQIPGEPGRFVYMHAMHEPGSHRLLGRAYAEDGAHQGEHALEGLAAHPSTSGFIATKLVRHFVADDPPPAAVERVAKVFRDSDGHLPSVHASLVDLDECWEPERRKLKTPDELVVSTLRGLDFARLPEKRLLGSLELLNQYPFSAPSPAGWPDSSEHWGSPNALLQRIDWSTQVGKRIASAREPRALLAHMSGPGENDALRLSVERAASASQGIALLLAGPDFQWR